MQSQNPDWVKHAVFYQIFPDRFAKSAKRQQRFLKSLSFEEKSLSFEDWDVEPTIQGYKGGDLWGVIERLNYLKKLGINAIYFTPIFQSPSNHRYNTHDYYQIDPLLGGNEAFSDLLDAAHHCNIKVVLDGVFNHCSRSFFFFSDVLENSPNSPWVNWFKFHKNQTGNIDWENWTSHAYDGRYSVIYEGWAGRRELPEFNHENPQVREYIMEIAEHWTRTGIDGWRLDVPFEITVPGFWQEFRQRVKAINPDAYIVGEIWDDASDWLDGTQFDGVMNYLFTAPTIAFTAGDRIFREMANPSCQPFPPLDAPGYAEKIKTLLNLYPWEIQLNQLNLLNSHDTARLITMAQGDKASVELATLLLMAFPGAPCIYYGDEVGLEGGPDPDCRRGFPAEDQWDHDVLAYHRRLIALRHTHPALRTGDYQILYGQGSVYGFARILGDEELIVAINTGIETTRARFEPSGFCLPQNTISTLKTQPDTILYGSGTAEWVDDSDSRYLMLTLPARTGIVLGSNKS